MKTTIKKTIIAAVLSMFIFTSCMKEVNERSDCWDIIDNTTNEIVTVLCGFTNYEMLDYQKKYLYPNKMRAVRHR